MVTAVIVPPVALPFETSYGVMSTVISSTKSILIGFFIVAKPLSFKPNASLKLTPSMVKSLSLEFLPNTEISVLLALAPFTLTLGSNLR